MFTGIIEELGVVKSIDRRDEFMRLGIAASFADTVKIGDSVSVNGACLTISEIGDTLRPDNYFPQQGVPTAYCLIYFDVMQETLKTTNLSKLKPNDKVNLEQALKAGDRLGGHFVTGHIDTVGTIKRKELKGEQAVFEIAVDAKFASGIVQKGSVAVDGISLTVANIKKGSGAFLFEVGIIPHTLKSTTLGFKRPGDTVNIELDAMGKYTPLRQGFGGQARQGAQDASEPAKGKITEEFLREHGF
jgi:riboflavin synthase